MNIEGMKTTAETHTLKAVVVRSMLARKSRRHDNNEDDDDAGSY